MGVSSEKIFIGTETIYLKVPPSMFNRELDRYTCGPNRVIWCDIYFGGAACNCYRQSAF